MGLLEVQQFTENHLAGLLYDLFKGVDLSKRFKVTRDIDEWKADTEEIWDIKRGNKPIHYSIYFDDEFVSSFTDQMSIVRIDKDFLSGFLELYQSARIFLHKELYKERDDKMKYEKMMADKTKKIQREKDVANMNTSDRETVMQILKETDKGTKHVPAK